MRLVFILLVYLSSLVKAADEADLHQSCQDPQSGSGHCADDSEIKPYFPIDPVLNEFEQEDPRLIKAIKERYLIPPSTKAYNFTNNAKVDMNGQFNQPIIIDHMFDHKLKKGFFIEAGAFDGEYISNTLLFELKHQWSGLLVEPNPIAFRELLQKNRRAWAFPGCFSTKTRPEVVTFDALDLFGGIVNPDGDKKPADDREASLKSKNKDKKVDRFSFQIQCFPLYSVLQALGNPTVHYFSLDIEGAELQVLKSVPWNKVDIKVLDIEINHLGEIFEGNPKQLDKLLKKNGFKYFRSIVIDSVYVKNDFDFNDEAFGG